MIIHKLGRTLNDNLGAWCWWSGTILQHAVSNESWFQNILGKELTYRVHTHPGDRGGIFGIPKARILGVYVGPLYQK